MRGNQSLRCRLVNIGPSYKQEARKRFGFPKSVGVGDDILLRINVTENTACFIGGRGKHSLGSVYFHGSGHAKSCQIRAGTKGENPRPTLADSVAVLGHRPWA